MEFSVKVQNLEFVFMFCNFKLLEQLLTTLYQMFALKHKIRRNIILGTKPTCHLKTTLPSKTFECSKLERRQIMY